MVAGWAAVTKEAEEAVAKAVAKAVEAVVKAEEAVKAVEVEVATAVEAEVAMGAMVAPRVAKVARVALAAQGAFAATAAAVVSPADSSRSLQWSSLVVAARVASRAAEVAKAVVAGAMGAKAGAVVAMVGAWVAEVPRVASAHSVGVAAAAGKVFLRTSRMASSFPAVAAGRTACSGPARRPCLPRSARRVASKARWQSAGGRFQRTTLADLQHESLV